MLDERCEWKAPCFMCHVSALHVWKASVMSQVRSLYFAKQTIAVVEACGSSGCLWVAVHVFINLRTCVCVCVCASVCNR